MIANMRCGMIIRLSSPWTSRAASDDVAIAKKMGIPMAMKRTNVAKSGISISGSLLSQQCPSPGEIVGEPD